MRLTPFAKLFITLVILGVIGYVFYHYGGLALLRPGSDAGQPAAAAAPGGPGTPAGTPAQIVLTLSGSNTIGATLAPALVEAYLRNAGATAIAVRPAGADETRVEAVLPGDQQPSAVEIHAHGSSDAFTDLASRGADIGMASRRVTDAEAARLAGLGDMRSPASEHVAALDGVAVIVHRANPLRSLDRTQVAGLFTGRTADWGDVGGTAGAVRLYVRDEKSGTADTFRSLVLGSSPIAPSARSFEDSRALSEAVAGDPAGIGFVGLAYVGSARALAVADSGARPLVPNYLTVASEDYFLARRLYFYTSSAPSSRLALPFVEFVLSREGQEVVRRAGFVEQNPERTSRTERLDTAAAGDAPAEYRRITAGAERLSLSFRFRSGSNQLDNKALRDVQRVADLLSLAEFAGRELVLAGFADSRGAADRNLALSQDRARAVAGELEAAGVKPAVVTGFGAANPVASNDTDDGREKNRRVEVWLRGRR
jgi:phosphate transport system substrate-binding protein